MHFIGSRRNTSRSDRSLLLWCKKVAVPQPSTKLPETTPALTVCCVLGQTFACAFGSSLGLVSAVVQGEFFAEPCHGQRRKAVLPTVTLIPLWCSVILAAPAGTMPGRRLTQHLTQSCWPRSEAKWNQIETFIWRSGPPSSRSWPSSCAGLTWNDLCDGATPRPNKWRPKCGNIGKDTGEITPGICRPMFVRLCQRNPARIWSG